MNLICGANARSTGQPCQAPVVPGKKRCKLHGGLTTRYGRNTKLLRWETHCIECGEEFTFETNKSKFSPLVRCKPHRIQRRRSRR